MLHNHLRNFTSHELPVHLDAPDKAHHRADGVDEFRRRVEIRCHHAGGFGDARHAVALSESGDVGSQQKGCEDNLFLFDVIVIIFFRFCASRLDIPFGG